MDDTQQVRNFILKNFLFSEEARALSDSGSLIASGAIDSTGVLELIMFIEETFRFKVADEEMIPDNLDSVEKIIGYVRRRRSGQE
ncbi:MAG: acyl carrier protein [Burkholderiales bacterium]